MSEQSDATTPTSSGAVDPASAEVAATGEVKETPSGTKAEQALEWATIVESGGMRPWVDAELRRRDLLDEGVDTEKLSDKQRKRYKARREQERRVRRELTAQAWACYRSANLVHLGAGIWYHDTADVDRYDIAEPETRREDNALPELKDARALADALGLPIPRLRWLAYHREVDSGTHYHRWTVPKRDGGRRLISAPKPDLRAAQRWIARRITEHLPVHGAAHGFIGGRSTETNARAHAGAKVVVKLDLKDFYPTVTWPRVKGLLRKAGYGEQVATVIALLCTESPRELITLRGKPYYVAMGPRSLPQGAPTSPSITNAICLRLDARLQGLAAKLGLRYSRYADDLTFSWYGAGDAPVSKILGGVKRIVAAEGFVVHPNKTRVMRAGGRQSVTGLVVNAAGEDRPPARVPRRFVRRLRAAVHNREQGREGGGEDLAQLMGWAAYVHMTDPEKARPLIARIKRLQQRETESGDE